jgi:hypothetical protein
VYGKILYLEDNLLLQAPLNSADFLNQLDTDGHYFAGEACHDNPKIQGYVLGSKVCCFYLASHSFQAYNEVLTPLVECGRRQCSKSELKLAPNPSKKYPCAALPKEIRT